MLISCNNKIKLKNFYDNNFFNIIGVILFVLGISMLSSYIGTYIFNANLSFLSALKHCSTIVGIIITFGGGLSLIISGR